MSEPLFDAVMSLDEAAGHLLDARGMAGMSARRLALALPEDALLDTDGYVISLIGAADERAHEALRKSRHALAHARLALSRAAREAAK